MSLRPRFMFSIILVIMPVTVLLLVYGILDAYRAHVYQMKTASQLASKIIEAHLDESGDTAAAAKLSARGISGLGLFRSWAVTDSRLRPVYVVNAPELSGPLLTASAMAAAGERKTKIAGNIVSVPLLRKGSVAGVFWATADPASVRLAFPPNRTWTLVVVMILSMAFITLMTYTAVSVQILGPLERLSEGARRIARGDYFRPVNASGARGESQQLIDIFNDMMTQVRYFRTDLESRIENATEKIVEGERHLAIAQKLAATGHLASGVAHEINNPLGGMMNVAKKLFEGSLDDSKRREYIRLLQDGLDSIKATVEKLLRFAPRTTKVTDVDLKAAVSDAIELVGHYASEREVRISSFVEDELTIRADAGEIRQVFVNLILNAVDASPDGAEIGVRSVVSATKVSLHFEDNGRGMSEEELSRAFDFFYTTKEPGKGSGLGLPIASSIVERYHGETRIESEFGKGTRVTVEFPRAPGTSGGTGS